MVVGGTHLLTWANTAVALSQLSCLASHLGDSLQSNRPTNRALSWLVYGVRLDKKCVTLQAGTAAPGEFAMLSFPFHSLGCPTVHKVRSFKKFEFVLKPANMCVSMWNSKGGGVRTNIVNPERQHCSSRNKQLIEPCQSTFRV